MLAPTDRRLLLDALAPPQGFALDQAVGTTYTLDLLALLRVPLAATILPWSNRDGEAVENPFALMTALRRHASRVSLFCQAGAIRVPARHQPLLTFLESSINEVVAPRGGVFHPKIWVLRFVADHDVAYRLLVLSRNLTFDRSWDIALVLDGALGTRRRAIGANNALGDFLAALPALASAAGASVDSATAARVNLLEDEVRRVSWELPEGFHAVVFHPLGHDTEDRWPFIDLYRLLVLSPFVSTTAIQSLADSVRSDFTLVSRLEEMMKVDNAVLDSLDGVHVFDDAQGAFDTSGCAEDPTESDQITSPADDLTTELSGLHAKVYLAEAYRRAVLYVGSPNATDAAFNRNVEFLVELEGSRAANGIDAMLSGLLDAGLVRPYVQTDERPPEDPVAEGLKLELERLAQGFATGTFWLKVVSDVPDRWRVELRAEASESIPVGATRIEARPITMALWRLVSINDDPLVTFPAASATELTPFMAFRLTASRDGRELTIEFVTRLRLEGAPPNRAEAVTAELLSDRERLLRFILLLLATSPSGTDALLDELEQISGDSPTGGHGRPPSTAISLPLLEPILRALHRDPERLDEVGTLIADLRKISAKSDLVPAELEELWRVIRAVRGEA